MTVLGAVVEWDQVWELVLVSLGATVGVAALFSIAINGSIRAVDARRAARPALAATYGVVTVLAVLGCLGAMAFGVAVIASK